MIRLAKIARIVLNELNISSHAQMRIDVRFDELTTMTENEKKHFKKTIDALKNTKINGKDPNMARIYGDGTYSFGVILFRLHETRKSDPKKYEKYNRYTSEKMSIGSHIVAIAKADDSFGNNDGTLITLYYEKYKTTLGHFNEKGANRPQKLFTMDPNFKLHEIPSNFYLKSNDGVTVVRDDVKLGALFDMVDTNKKTILNSEGKISNAETHRDYDAAIKEMLRRSIEFAPRYAEDAEGYAADAEGYAEMAKQNIEYYTKILRENPDLSNFINKKIEFANTAIEFANAAREAANVAREGADEIDEDSNAKKTYDSIVKASEDAKTAALDAKNALDNSSQKPLNKMKKYDRNK